MLWPLIHIKFLFYILILAVCLVKLTIIFISSIYVAANDGFREGYFNGSSQVILNTPLSLYNHIGLSFKSCVGGELFEQHINGNVVSTTF